VRWIARLVLVTGIAGLGLFFLRATPREVTLVYDICSPVARTLEVDIEREGKMVRRAEFRLARTPPAQVNHAVRLKDGNYLLRISVSGADGSRRVERPIAITENTTIVIPCSR